RVAGVGKKNGCHGRGVPEELSLRRALRGPEHLRGIRQLDAAAADVAVGDGDVPRDLDARRGVRGHGGTCALGGVVIARRETGRRRRSVAARTRLRGDGPAPTRRRAATHQRTGARRGGRGPWRTAPATGT